MSRMPRSPTGTGATRIRCRVGVGIVRTAPVASASRWSRADPLLLLVLLAALQSQEQESGTASRSQPAGTAALLLLSRSHSGRAATAGATEPSPVRGPGAGGSAAMPRVALLDDFCALFLVVLLLTEPENGQERVPEAADDAAHTQEQKQNDTGNGSNDNARNRATTQRVIRSGGHGRSPRTGARSGGAGRRAGASRRSRRPSTGHPVGRRKASGDSGGRGADCGSRGPGSGARIGRTLAAEGAVLPVGTADGAARNLTSAIGRYAVLTVGSARRRCRGARNVGAPGAGVSDGPCRGAGYVSSPGRTRRYVIGGDTRLVVTAAELI